MKRLALLLSAALFLSNCKKENDRAQWDVAILTPIFKATLTVGDLIGDSLKMVSPDGAVTVVYDNNIYSTPVDSIFEIHDTLISTVFPSPGIISLMPGQVFYSQPEVMDLALNGVELSTAIIKSGYARLVAKNHLQTKVIYTFNIPKATLSGVPFQKIQALDAAPPGGFTEFDQKFDISGYSIDLTGPAGTIYNHITYTVQGETDPTGTSVTLAVGDTVVDVTSGFESLIPLYAKGYLGQGTVSESGENRLGTSKIGGGTILLDSVSATLTIKNSIGADAQALLTSMQSVNTRTGSTVDLVAPNLVNHILNLNRASESGTAPAPINSTYYVVQLDNTNSNILSLVENLPEKLTYDLNFNLNPLGNVSGHHDFIYTDDLFEANLKVNFPLRFAANQILFADTESIALGTSTTSDNVGDGTFTIIADNGFPFELELQLMILNNNNQAVDSLFFPNTIAPAPLNGLYRATGKQRTLIPIAVSVSRKNLLLSASRIAIRARFSTSSYPHILQIYSDYELDLKLVGDFQYSIR